MEERMCETSVLRNEWAFHSQREGRNQVRKPREVHGGWIASLHGPEWLVNKVRGKGYWRKWPEKVDGRSCWVLDHMV